MQFGLLGNLKGLDLVAGGRARQRRPRLEKHTGQDPEGVRYCAQMWPLQGQIWTCSVGVAKRSPTAT